MNRSSTTNDDSRDGKLQAQKASRSATPDPSEPVWYLSVWFWFWGGLLSAGLPLLVIYFSRMWRLPHYQYFPFALGAVAWLAWSRSDRKLYPPTSVISFAAIGLGVLGLVGAWTARSPWMASIAFFFFAAAFLNSLRSQRFRSLIALALPLALLVRLPLGYDHLLVIELQRITTVMSSLMLDVIGVSHAVSRNVIQLPQRELFVAEACSGIQSVFTLMFLSTLLIAVLRRRLWLAPFYLVIALLLAIAGNVLRVTTVAAADSRLGLDWASGWAHDLLGYATLGLSSLLLISFDQVVVVLLHPTSSISASSETNPLVRLWNWLVDDGMTVDATAEYYLGPDQRRRPQRLGYQNDVARWMRRMQIKPVTIATAVLMVAMLVVSTQRAFSVDRFAGIQGGMGMFVDGLIHVPSEAIFRDVSDEFQVTDRQSFRDNENPILGKNADVWKYSRPTIATGGLASGLAGQFVVSQTYSEFHELCLCYENQDWRLLNRYRKEVGTGADALAGVGATDSEIGGDSIVQATAQTPVAYATFRTPEGGRGYLWYASITASGRMMLPPERPGRLGSRFSESFPGQTESSEPIMMVQLWVTSDRSLSVDVTKKLTDDFAALRRRVAMEVAR